MLRVLVVDDNTMVRESFVELLSRRGYGVAEAEDGERAIGVIRRSPYQLAIVDVMMPTMGGLEFRQELKTIAPKTKVIFVTGQPDRFEQLVEDDPDYIDGAMNVLFKPVHPVKLLAEVERLIGVPEDEAPETDAAIS
jgi:two-component system, OmpR family, response regulator